MLHYPSWGYSPKELWQRGIRAKCLCWWYAQAKSRVGVSHPTFMSWLQHLTSSAHSSLLTFNLILSSHHTHVHWLTFLFPHTYGCLIPKATLPYLDLLQTSLSPLSPLRTPSSWSPPHQSSFQPASECFVGVPISPGKHCSDPNTITLRAQDPETGLVPGLRFWARGREEHFSSPTCVYCCKSFINCAEWKASATMVFLISISPWELQPL